MHMYYQLKKYMCFVKLYSTLKLLYSSSEFFYKVKQGTARLYSVWSKLHLCHSNKTEFKETDAICHLININCSYFHCYSSWGMFCLTMRVIAPVMFCLTTGSTTSRVNNDKRKGLLPQRNVFWFCVSSRNLGPSKELPATLTRAFEDWSGTGQKQTTRKHYSNW